MMWISGRCHTNATDGDVYQVGDEFDNWWTRVPTVAVLVGLVMDSPHCTSLWSAQNFVVFSNLSQVLEN